MVSRGTEVDMAARLGRLADSGLGARRLASAPRFAVAAPAYLTERGRPSSPSELSRHDRIVGPGLSARQDWRFMRSGTVSSVAVEGRVQVAAADGVIACAKAGLGIAIASQWMCRAELESGELVPILSDYQLDPVDVHAVFPGGRRPSTKIRVPSDYLAASLGAKAAPGKS